MTEKTATKTPEVSIDALGTLIGKTLSESLTPLVDSVKEVTKKVADFDAMTRDHLVTEPEKQAREQQKSYEERCEEWEKKHYERIKKEGDRFALPAEDEFSFVRFLRAQVNKDWAQAPYEKWCLDKTRKKALSYGTTTAGGYVVDSQYLPQEFIENLYAAMVLRRGGARFLPCTGAPVNIPAMTAGGTAYWVAENATLTPADQTFNQVQLTPKWCIGRTQLSEFLVQTSAPAAESIVREDLARVIGVEVDKQCIVGTGTTNKPYGIINSQSPGTLNTYDIGTNGGAFTLAGAHSMLYELEYDKIPTDNLFWIMHPRTWNTIRQFQTENYSTQTSGGDYYFRPDVTQRETRMLLGYPVYTTTSLSIALTKGSGSALGYVILVRGPDVLIGEWGAIDIRVTDVGGDAWAKNMIEVKATYTMDTALRRAESACVCDDTSS